MLSRIIQLYPAYKKNLQNRYAIARNTENQRKLLEEKTKAVHGNLQLIHATNDVYIPDSFIMILLLIWIKREYLKKRLLNY
ncbi:MAG: hypothetical protein ACLVHS_04680 [Blautia wexlerae]